MKFGLFFRRTPRAPNRDTRTTVTHKTKPTLTSEECALEVQLSITVGSTSSRTCQLFPIFGSTIYFGPEILQLFFNYYSTIFQLLVETKLNNS